MHSLRALRHPMLAVAASAAVFWMASRVWAIGFVLGQTKEELQLKYDVSVQDHGTRRITVVFTLADEGRLKPLDEVQLVIPGQEENEDGGRWMDLVVSIDMTKVDGDKRIGRIHIRKAFAERAEIWLNTHTMDGKMDPLTRLHHVIPIAKFIKDSPEAAVEPAGAPPTKPTPPLAAERKSG